MATAPIYKSNVRNPQPGSIDIAPIALPHLPAYEATVGALQDLGATATRWYDQLKGARDTVNKANSATNYVTQLSALEDRYNQDPDYQTAPTRFAEDVTRLEREALDSANLDPADRATLQLTLRQQALASFGRVQTKSVASHTAAAATGLEEDALALANAASRGSPVERDMHTTQFDSGVDAKVRTGLISPAVGAKAKLDFRSTVQDARAGLLIGKDPAAAVVYLANPENTKYINPKRVVELLNSAQAANDTLATDQVVAKIKADGSYAAGATLNTILVPGDRTAVFEKGIIPTEGGINKKTGAGLTSPAGALGISQILPGTARDVARSLGMNDIAHLSNEDLQERLLNDHVLNAKLGQTYFNQQLARYNGNIALAAAAYNAGPGRADEWAKRATAQFGENFTAAQLQSVIGIKETRDYVGRVFTNLGVPSDGLNVSQHGYYRAVTAATTEIEQQAAAEVRVVRQIASADWSNDPILELLQRGAPLDGPRVTAHLAIQDQAAATGDAEAANRARQIRTAIQVQPLVNSAWGMRTDALGAEVDRREALLQSGGVQTEASLDELDALKKVFDSKRTEAVQTAANARAEDPIDVVFAAGGTVDQERLDKHLAANLLAAVLGDSASIAYLREVETRYGMQPILDAARQQPPEVVAAEIKRREAIVQTAADAATIVELKKVLATSSADVKDQARVQRADDPVDKLLEAGVVIAPERLAEIVRVQTAAAKLGDTEAIEYLRKIGTLARIQPALELAAQMHPSELQAVIAQRQLDIDSSPNASEAELLALTALKAVQAEQAKTLAAGDIVQAGERAKLYAPVALDVAANPTDGAFRNALTQRSVQATVATQPQNVGGGYSPKPFHPGEAQALKQRFEDAGLSEKLGLLDAMHSSMSGRVFAAAIDQLGLSGIEQAAALFANRGELPKKILTGAQYLNVKGVEVQATELRAAMQGQLGGDLWGGGGSAALKNVVDAAAAVYVADRGGNASLWKADDAEALKRAIQEVTGELTSRGGAKVAAPPAMTTATFHAAIDRMSNQTLAGFGGAMDRNGQVLTAEEIGQIAVFKQRTPGSSLYYVGTNNGPGADRFQPYLTASRWQREELVIDMTKAATMPPRAFDPREGLPSPGAAIQRGLQATPEVVGGAVTGAAKAVGDTIQAVPGAIQAIPGAVGDAVRGLYPEGYQLPANPLSPRSLSAPEVRPPAGVGVLQPGDPGYRAPGK